MSGIGGVGGAGNGNSWGNYGSTSNQPSTGGYAAPQARYGTQPQSLPHQSSSPIAASWGSQTPTSAQRQARPNYSANPYIERGTQPYTSNPIHTTHEVNGDEKTSTTYMMLQKPSFPNHGSYMKKYTVDYGPSSVLGRKVESNFEQVGHSSVPKDVKNSLQNWEKNNGRGILGRKIS